MTNHDMDIIIKNKIRHILPDPSFSMGKWVIILDIRCLLKFIIFLLLMISNKLIWNEPMNKSHNSPNRRCSGCDIPIRKENKKTK